MLLNMLLKNMNKVIAALAEKKKYYHNNGKLRVIKNLCKWVYYLLTNLPKTKKESSLFYEKKSRQ